ncbi:BTB/POZ domain-containing protein At3g22104 [Lolium rigidum]|uniref:BTB/POZ domain-containing protein At3g22104 n=1 Tax=Lolium rigidum TaxID=89674 RepID=UPI001F5CFF4B|nr:BTB/POZ domain-containing protein At3g22104 [Lolium rigidum]XP_047067390.1 BTB/POZ domain-containing protein At3g22104 [Lolium rigidum]
MGCVLEVDVDGEGVFFVDKDVLAPFIGKIKELTDERPVIAPARTARRRVALHGFPGGAEAFELVARFCYTGGTGLAVTAANACALRCAAQFMDMADAPASSAKPSLVKMTEKVLDEMPHWPWQAVVDAVKECQRLFPLSESTGVFDRVVGALLSQMAVPGDATPTSSSPESSAFRFSCDTKCSSLSMRRTWWFEDLVVLSPVMVERVAKALLARGADHGIVARFIFYYLKCRIAGASADDKKAMLEAAIAVIADLDRSSVSCKGLFGILRIASPLKLGGACQDTLVDMIGRKLDHATLDNLLVPAPSGTGSLYDVSLVLRFLEAFMRHTGGAQVDPPRLKKVGALMDMYVAEVAPDPSLRPARFVELATSLPAAARDCHDALYRAIDVYFQVHARLTDDEKMKICKGINYEKLSPECCKHLATNAGFPTRAAVQALASQHTVLKGIIRHSGPLKPASSPPPPFTGKYHQHIESYNDIDGDDGNGQVVLYASRLDLSLENQNLKSLLDGMHWRVMELEKVCSRMKTQMTKMKSSRRRAARSLPKMCS